MVRATDDGTRDDLLRGKQVAIAGTMASMSREEADDLIRKCGGQPTREPGAGTAFVVVGQEGWPVGEDGRITDELERARRLQDEGAELRVIGEQEFLEMLRLAGERAAETVRRLYTVTQLSRILKIPGRRIRAWVRRGLIRPARTELRLHFFDFRQMTELKTLRRLTEEGVPLTEIRASLEKLRRWFPEAEGSLGQLSKLEGQLLTRVEGGAVAEPSGQLRLGFDLPPTAPPPPPDPEAPVLRVVADISPVRPERVAADAEDWFDRALELEEEEDLGRAVRAYEQALLQGGPDAEVAFNLGNALYALGRLDEAIVRFEQAVTIDPDYVEAWNNLGGVHADVGQWDQAIVAATRALELAPTYADPHYNLAEAYVASGRYGDARLHAARYFQHDPDSPWAERLRKDLGIRR
jgi:tetratricopeptide (TPR) repeat protein